MNLKPFHKPLCGPFVIILNILSIYTIVNFFATSVYARKITGSIGKKMIKNKSIISDKHSLTVGFIVIHLKKVLNEKSVGEICCGIFIRWN